MSTIFKVEDIHSQEDAPRLSAFDPYCETAFGNISFTIKKKRFSCSTADRCTDYLTVDGVTHYLTRATASDVTDFIRRIWDETTVNLRPEEIPRVILSFLQ